MNLFQIITIGVFTFFLIFAVLVFSGVIPIFTTAPQGVSGTVTLWGIIPEARFRNSLAVFNKTHEKIFSIQYVQKNEDFFDRDLVEAIASGKGPDMVLLPQDLVVRHTDKVTPISYETLSLRDFRDTFIEEGELFIGDEEVGILALPFSVDPMILFWNRDIFNANTISLPPELWDQLLALAPVLTATDNAFNVNQSAIAFGEFENVTHAKDILALLILQAGNPIVERKEGKLTAVLEERRGLVVAPGESALRFYTEFSNPSKPVYSWNRSLPESKEFFVSNDLGVYVGYASEIPDIRAQSPNLNFDIALVPIGL